MLSVVSCVETGSRSLANQFKHLSLVSTPVAWRAPAAATALASAPAAVSSALSLASRLPFWTAQWTQQIRAKSYKLKTKSAVKKRFRVNANGTMKRAQANKRHIATKKTRERIRRLGKNVTVQGKIKKNLMDMLH